MEQRTIKQNSALHLYFEMVAGVLNDAGLDMKVVLKPEIEIPWSADTVKDFLWRPVQRLQVGKKSTTELDTKEVSDIWEVMNRHLSEKFGIFVDFPSLQSLIDKQNAKSN